MTAPGLEEILAQEITRLTGRIGEATAGGVAFAGGLKDMRRVNLWSRVANRVLVRIDEFHASSFYELERRAKQIDWTRFVSEGQPVRFRVTCRKSRLYHSDAVAERFAAALNGKVGRNKHIVGKEHVDGQDEADESADAQLFVIRIVDDLCSVSADSSGDLLHRRGYRQAVAKAPLRETIAAAMLIGSGWDMKSPLVDPMCGAGTIPIEAAMMSRNIAPGLNRQFAFQKWPKHDDSAWMKELEVARAEARPASRAKISGSDRDEGAILAAKANAERAGVAADINFSVNAVSAAEFPGSAGWFVTNPPYGLRVGESGALRNLYAQLGKVLRENAQGYTIAMLSADSELEAQLKLDLHEVFHTTNGGIPVHLVVGNAE
jgi:putative N6-adenine-specific DNA methylase